MVFRSERVLIIALVALVACSGGGAVEQAAEGDALVSRSARVLVESPNTLDVVEFVQAEVFTVQRLVTLLGARPHEMPDSVELLAARIDFLRSDRYVTTGGLSPGYICTHWPPAGFGPTYNIRNLRVDVGDKFAVAFFLRAKQPGHHVVRGVDITYELDGRRLGQQSSALTVDMLRTEEVTELPEGVRGCYPEAWERFVFFQPDDRVPTG